MRELWIDEIELISNMPRLGVLLALSSSTEDNSPILVSTSSFNEKVCTLITWIHVANREELYMDWVASDSIPYICENIE